MKELSSKVENKVGTYVKYVPLSQHLKIKVMKMLKLVSCEQLHSINPEQTYLVIQHNIDDDVTPFKASGKKVHEHLAEKYHQYAGESNEDFFYRIDGAVANDGTEEWFEIYEL